MLKLRALVAVAGAVAALGGIQGATAGPLSQPAGGMLTHGGTGPFEANIASIANPAAASVSERRLRAAVLSNIGFGIEVGDAEDFDQRIDDVVDQFDLLELRLDQLQFGPMPTVAEVEQLVADLNAFESDANAVVNDLADNAYAKLTFAMVGPGAPLAFRSNTLGGVITLNYEGHVEARVAVEASGDAFTFGLPAAEDFTVQDPGSFEVFTDANGNHVLSVDGTEYSVRATEDAGVAVQGGVVSRLSAGYSREIWSSGAGRLHLGGSASAYRVSLARAGRLINEGDVEDTASDDFDDNQTTSTGLGIDAGVIWVADMYSVGATVKNITAPSFSYPELCNGSAPESCAFFTANPQAARNGDSWTMERQLTLEGALYNANRNWLVTALVDANSATDSTGDEYQWAAVGVSYRPGLSWVPSPRVGYRRNLAGEELDHVSAGLSFFRGIIELDVSRAMGSTSFDGSSYPRALQVNLGLGLRW